MQSPRTFVLCGTSQDAAPATLEAAGHAPSPNRIATDANHRESPWDTAHRLARTPAAFALESMPADAYVEPNITQRFRYDSEPTLEGTKTRSDAGLHPFWPPSDDEFTFAWHLERSGLRAAREAVGDAEPRVRVGILDTGYDPTHITTPAHLEVALQRNFVEDDRPDDATDVTGPGFFHNAGHGPATIAILAGNRVPQLGDGFLGGCPHAAVVPVRIADSVVHFSTESMAQGIRYAASVGCRVISISMGGLPSRSWADAVNEAYEQGVTVVAAAGNRFGPLPPATLVYPARFHRVIAACGVTYDGTPYYRPGAHAEMQGSAGPTKRMGSAIAAYTPNIPWVRGDASDAIANDGGGTSSATPQIAAAATLWLQKHQQSLPPGERWKHVEAVRHALFSTARAPGAASDDRLGHGVLDAHGALGVDWQAASAHIAEPAKRARVGFFSWFHVVSGLEAATPHGTEAMLATEAMQLYLLSPELQDIAGNLDPVDDAEELDDDRAVQRDLVDHMRRTPGISNTLRGRLEQLSGRL